MNLSILHISDLHRDLSNSLRNSILLDSLKRDRDRYTSNETPCIRPPDLIIVSGDIIQGVKVGSSDVETKLQRQYDEALRFLSNLTDEFIDGNKQAIVIVPGNHDISDHHFRQSLMSIDIASEAKRELVQQLFETDSKLRWSWAEFALYRIHDAEMYRTRFDAFVNFYNDFYEGERSYSNDPTEQFDIFDFPDWCITVIGFCSCYNNDLLNKQGTIHPDCIAQAGQHLRAATYIDRLRIATWHHNIEGPPLKADYMDPDIVQNLIDSGFSLGFHGHQHKPQFLDSRFRHGPDRRLSIISAGTLCGSAAFHFRRSYNLIELNTENRTGRLFVREMQNDDLQRPIWGSRLLPPRLESYLDFVFDPPPTLFTGANSSTLLLTRAEKLLSNCKYREAAEVLLPLTETEDLARPMLLECLIRLGDMQGITANFDPPKGPTEAVALMDALWSLRRRTRLSEVLEMEPIGNSTDPSVIEIRNKYKVRLHR